jgi:hypothetical protein
MEGSKANRKPADLSRINVDEGWELEWWSAHFQTTPERVRWAVSRSGPTPAEVEAQLKHAAHEAFKNTGED